MVHVFVTLRNYIQLLNRRKDHARQQELVTFSVAVKNPRLSGVQPEIQSPRLKMKAEKHAIFDKIVQGEHNKTRDSINSYRHIPIKHSENILKIVHCEFPFTLKKSKHRKLRSTLYSTLHQFSASWPVLFQRMA